MGETHQYLSRGFPFCAQAINSKFLLLATEATFPNRTYFAGVKAAQSRLKL